MAIAVDIPGREDLVPEGPLALASDLGPGEHLVGLYRHSTRSTEVHPQLPAHLGRIRSDDQVIVAVAIDVLNDAEGRAEVDVAVL